MCPVPPKIELGRILWSLGRMKHYPIAISLFNPSIARFPCICRDSQTAFSIHSGMVSSLRVRSRKHSNIHNKVVAQGFHTTQVTYGILIGGLCKIGETKVVIQFCFEEELKADQLSLLR